MTGHLLGAAGGARDRHRRAGAARPGRCPPTINLDNPDAECDLDYTPHRRRAPARCAYAISNSFGFGGTNACIVLGKLR